MICLLFLPDSEGESSRNIFLSLFRPHQANGGFDNAGTSGPHSVLQLLRIETDGPTSFNKRNGIAVDKFIDVSSFITGNLRRLIDFDQFGGRVALAISMILALRGDSGG